ncbi:MAG: YIP1 family protein [Halobacteriales archaeon]|nr:YIP1 family protein [Halobacteriales archaeon]
MTSWVESPGGGRDRGPRGVLRAWVEVLTRPRRFFAHGVSAGDQGPGLTFLMAVVAFEEVTRLLLVPEAVPALVGGRWLSFALVVGLATLLVAPLGLHLVGAAQILLLRPLVAERAGVSQTVQVLAYAAAPCALAGVPEPTIRVACAAYGTALLVIGLATVHGTGYARAAVAGAIPAAAVFGYGFRGVAAAGELWAQLAAATGLF